MHKGLKCKNGWTLGDVFIDPVDNQPLIKLINQMAFDLLDKNFINLNDPFLQSLLVLSTSYKFLISLSLVADHARTTDCSRGSKV